MAANKDVRNVISALPSKAENQSSASFDKEHFFHSSVPLFLRGEIISSSCCNKNYSGTVTGTAEYNARRCGTAQDKNRNSLKQRGGTMAANNDVRNVISALPSKAENQSSASFDKEHFFHSSVPLFLRGENISASCCNENYSGTAAGAAEYNARRCGTTQDKNRNSLKQRGGTMAANKDVRNVISALPSEGENQSSASFDEEHFFHSSVPLSLCGEIISSLRRTGLPGNCCRHSSI
jgi:hypothetical protein